MSTTGLSAGGAHLEGQWQHASPWTHGLPPFWSFLSTPRGRAHLFLLKAWGGLLGGLYFPALLVRLRSAAGVTTSELSLCALGPVIRPTSQQGGF